MSIRFMRILRSIGLLLLLLSISGLAVSDDKAITESSPLPANARRFPRMNIFSFSIPWRFFSQMAAWRCGKISTC